MTLDDCTVYTHADSMNPDAREQLRSSGVTVMQYDQVWQDLQSWGSQLEEQRRAAGDRPETPPVTMKIDGEEKKVAKPTHKASISSKTSWAIAHALGKVSPRPLIAICPAAYSARTMSKSGDLSWRT